MNNTLILSNFIFGNGIDIYSKLVYIVLKKYLNSESGVCFSAKKKLAEECGISLSTLSKALQKLIDLKVLKKEFRYRKNKSQTSNLYTLTSFLTSSEYYFKLRKDILNMKLKANEIVVYSYLCSMANQDMECYPSIKTIAAACSISETTVKTTLKNLMSKNLIEKINQFRADGGRKNNLYKIMGNEEVISELTGEISEQDKHENFECIPHAESEEKIIDNNKEILNMNITKNIFKHELSVNNLSVYAFLCSVANQDMKCCPSIKKIATVCNISETTVKGSIKELANKKLIEKINQYRADGGRGNNMYKVIQEEQKTLDDEIQKPIGDIFNYNLSSNVFAVYIFLWLNSNQDMQCSPTLGKMCVTCNLSRTAVSNALNELVKMKLIEKENQYRADGGNIANLYKIVKRDNHALRFGYG